MTGVWLDCDTQASDFDRCLFHQAVDDDLDFDRRGIISKKGLVRIYSPPQHQWGPRCLSIRLRTSSKITLGVSGTTANKSYPPSDIINTKYTKD